MLLAKGMVGCVVSVMSSGVPHMIDFAALMHTAICWQSQGASCTHDLQVSRERSEQKRNLAAKCLWTHCAACGHVLQRALACGWRKELLLLVLLVLALCTLCWEFTLSPDVTWLDTGRARFTPASRIQGACTASSAPTSFSKAFAFSSAYLCLPLLHYRQMDRCSITAYKRYRCRFIPSSSLRQKKEEKQCKSKCLLCKLVSRDIRSTFRFNPSREPFIPSTADLWSDVSLCQPPDNLSSCSQSHWLQGHTDMLGMQGKVLKSCPWLTHIKACSKRPRSQ